ncbi:unnamed protein product [Ectocarpus sp. 12 AP-2014]
MKYDYTWNHILLFARICGRIDDADSVTASWVQITEDHNRQTFPFTLWPLTYRTCEVTTSPAMCSPVHIPSTDLLCNYDVKLFKCNEVMIICIQECEPSSAWSCGHPCFADPGGAIDDEDEIEAEPTAGCAIVDRDHVKAHSASRSEPLLPCHVSHCYDRIRVKVMDALYEMQEGMESAIRIGHGAAAALASCLASDMSRQYEAEKEFLGLETRRVGVDFVGFSESVVASQAYWDDRSCYVDEYVLVALGCSTPGSRVQASNGSLMIPNPRSSRVTIDRVAQPPLSRPRSVFRDLGKRFGKLQRHHKNPAGGEIEPNTAAAEQPVLSYVSALLDKVNIPLQADRAGE